MQTTHSNALPATVSQLATQSLARWSFRTYAFYGLLLLSGFCGISYEILYARLLGNLLGDQLVVSASILMTFLVGIGIGTRYAHRLWRFLWLIELGIGLCGFGYAFSASWLDRLLYAGTWGLARSAVGQLLVCVVLLIVPAMLVGCSLPLFAGYLSRLIGGRVFARAYAVYNIGAAVTAMLIEFSILRIFGLRGALVAIALLNLCVAAALRRGFAGLRAKRPDPAVPVQFPWRDQLAIGLVSVGSAAFQLMMMKVAECLFGPFHETFALVLATVLLGIAVGSVVVDRLQFGFDMVVGSALVGLGWLLWSFDSVAAWYAGQYAVAVDSPLQLALVKLAAVLMLMGLPAAAFGATIPALLREQSNVAKESGQLLFISSMANAAGFLLMAFVLHRSLSYGAIVLAVATLSALGIVVRYGFRLQLVAAVGALLLAAAGIGRKVWDEQLLYLGHTAFHSADDLRETRETLEGTQVFKGRRDLFAITTIDGEPYFFINGYISIPLSSPSERIVGAFSSIFAPRTDRALVLGVGSGATAGTVGQVFEQTTAVEINPVILENLYRMKDYNFDIEKNPRVHIVLDDAIHFVKTDQQRYSLVINTVTTPLYFSSSKLYTDDFLKHVRQRLQPGGVYVTWFDGRVGDRGLDIILKTLERSFPYCAVASIKSSYFLLLCSDRPVRAHHPDLVAHTVPLAEYFDQQCDLNPQWFAYGLLCSNAYDLIKDRYVPLNTLNYPSLEFEMSRLAGGGIGRSIQRMTRHMSLQDQQAALGDALQWDPANLLLYVDELLGDCSVTERWSELVEEEFPDAYQRVQLARLARYADRARGRGTADDWFDYGFQLLKLEEYQQAAEAFQRVVQIDPQFDNAHFNLGTCYDHLEQFQQALAEYEMEGRVDPEDEDVPYRVGRAALRAGQLDKAVTALREAIAITNDSENHQLLGEALAGLGRRKEAAAELQQALELDPQNEAARRLLHQLHANSF